MDKSNSRFISELRSTDNNSLDNFQISIHLNEILEKKLPVGDTFNYKNLTIEVTDADEKIVNEIKVTINSEENKQ